MLVRPGDRVTFSKTLTAADVAAFVALSGDDYEAHTDAAAMARTSFGARIVHGALLVALMSAAGTSMIRAMQARGDTTSPVSLGYDRVRFVAPVFFGDTVTVSYEVTAIEPDRDRSIAALEALNQHGAPVAVAHHVMKWLPATAGAPA